MDISQSLSTADTETYPQAVLGFRAWAVKEGMLCPLFRGPAWRPDDNIAYCMHHQHVAPAERCHCGFNAYHDINRAIAEAEAAWCDDYDNAVSVREFVVGAVAARGAVQVHAHGFRCETAQVLGIFPLHERIAPIPDLDARYQVPVYEDAGQLLDAVGKLPVEAAPTEIRPEDTADPIIRTVDQDYTLAERAGAVGLALVFLSPLALATITIGAALGWHPASINVLAVYLVVGLLFSICAGLFRRNSN